MEVLKTKDCQILKVSEELGLIFGWAAICTKDGAEFWDSDNEHYPEDAMLRDATEFAKVRVACTMHQRTGGGEPVQSGGIVHMFPMTGEIAKALDIQTNITGLLIAMQPDNKDDLEKAKSGEYTGFSIGGEIIDAEYEA